VLIACLLLSGCGSWMDGSYSSVKEHQFNSSESGTLDASAKDLVSLRDAVTRIIRNGFEKSIIFVKDYDQTIVQQDMMRVVQYIKNIYPVGIFSVEDIFCEFGTNSGMPAIAITVVYSRDISDLQRLKTVEDLDAVKRELAEVLVNYDTSVLLYVKDYESFDLDQWVENYGEEHPDLIMEIPRVSLQTYPEEGFARVLDIKFTYETNRDSLRNMQSEVSNIFTSAVLYVSGNYDTFEKYNLLYSHLMERYEYQYETSITPAYSLLTYGVGDAEAFAIVYGAMCRKAGLECITVSGTRAGEPWYWNMICVDGVYMHIDLLKCNEKGTFRGDYDSQMSGYVWDYSAYPACTPDTGSEE